jgi:hypothetical protein
MIAAKALFRAPHGTVARADPHFVHLRAGIDQESQPGASQLPADKRTEGWCRSRGLASTVGPDLLWLVAA